jgi:hypothetical protein
MIMIVGTLVSMAWASETRGLALGESAALPSEGAKAIAPGCTDQPAGAQRSDVMAEL